VPEQSRGFEESFTPEGRDAIPLAQSETVQAVEEPGATHPETLPAPCRRRGCACSCPCQRCCGAGTRGSGPLAPPPLPRRAPRRPSPRVRAFCATPRRAGAQTPHWKAAGSTGPRQTTRRPGNLQRSSSPDPPPSQVIGCHRLRCSRACSCSLPRHCCVPSRKLKATASDGQHAVKLTQTPLG